MNNERGSNIKAVVLDECAFDEVDQVALRKLCTQRLNQVLNEERKLLQEQLGINVTPPEPTEVDEIDASHLGYTKVDFKINRELSWPSKDNPTTTCVTLGVTCVIDDSFTVPLDINEDLFDLISEIVRTNARHTYHTNTDPSLNTHVPNWSLL